MRVTPSPLISSATGSIGSTCFRSFRGRMFVNKKPSPTNRTTKASLLRKSAVARATHEYDALSATARAQWSTLYLSSTRSANTGQAIAHSVRTFAVRYFLHWYSTADAPPVQLPEYRSYGTIFPTTLTFTTAGAGCLSYDRTSPAVYGWFWLFAARCFSDKRRPIRNWVYMRSGQHIYNYADDFGGYFLARLGQPALGEAIVVRSKIIPLYSYLPLTFEVSCNVTT